MEETINVEIGKAAEMPSIRLCMAGARLQCRRRYEYLKSFEFAEKD